MTKGKVSSFDVGAEVIVCYKHVQIRPSCTAFFGLPRPWVTSHPAVLHANFFFASSAYPTRQSSHWYIFVGFTPVAYSDMCRRGNVLNCKLFILEREIPMISKTSCNGTSANDITRILNRMAIRASTSRSVGSVCQSANRGHSLSSCLCLYDL